MTPDVIAAGIALFIFRVFVSGGIIMLGLSLPAFFIWRWLEHDFEVDRAAALGKSPRCEERWCDDPTCSLPKNLRHTHRD
jgi:hypothetical protein